MLLYLSSFGNFEEKNIKMITNKTNLTKTHSKSFKTLNKKVLNHWIAQRITAIMMIPSIILFLYWFVVGTKQGTLDQDLMTGIIYDAYNGTNVVLLSWNIIGLGSSMYMKKLFVLVVLGIILIHIVEGLENVIMDYVSNEKLKTITFILIKLLQIFILKSILMYLRPF